MYATNGFLLYTEKFHGLGKKNTVQFYFLRWKSVYNRLSFLLVSDFAWTGFTVLIIYFGVTFNYWYTVISFTFIRCGDLADALVIEILNNGYLTMSEALLNVFERLQDTKETLSAGLYLFCSLYLYVSIIHLWIGWYKTHIKKLASYNRRGKNHVLIILLYGTVSLCAGKTSQKTNA